MHRVFADFRVSQPIAAHEQITAHLRQQIFGGKLAPGARLPTTQELARTWGVTVTTIQSALAPLVKEGLLLRRPRVGTIVCERGSALRRIALYRPTDPGRERRDHYARRIAAAIAAQVAAAGTEVVYFTDMRPEPDQVAPPSDLLRAVQTRQVEALIATECNRRIAPWLSRLPVPTAAAGSDRGPTEVCEDYGQFAREGVDCLVARGCRSVGLISVTQAGETYADGSPHVYSALYAEFLASAATLGLATRPQWLRTAPPGVHIHENEAGRFGFEAVQAVCGGPERPDGLLVFTDLVGHGVVMGLLALRSEGVPHPHLVMHRNSEAGLFCPLPADFLENRIDGVAEALLGCIAAQRQGRPTAFTLLPYTAIRT